MGSHSGPNSCAETRIALHAQAFWLDMARGRPDRSHPLANREGGKPFSKGAAIQTGFRFGFGRKMPGPNF